MKTIKVKPGQTITDLAVQYLGDQSGGIAIASLNGLSLTDSLFAGQSVIIPDQLDKRVAKVMSENNYQPAAGQQVSQEGIGFSGIEIDFEVQ